MEDGTLAMSINLTTEELANWKIEISHPSLIDRRIIGKVEDRTLAVSTHRTTEELAKSFGALVPLHSWSGSHAQCRWPRCNNWYVQLWGALHIFIAFWVWIEPHEALHMFMAFRVWTVSGVDFLLYRSKFQSGSHLCYEIIIWDSIMNDHHQRNGQCKKANLTKSNGELSQCLLIRTPKKRLSLTPRNGLSQEAYSRSCRSLGHREIGKVKKRTLAVSTHWDGTLRKRQSLMVNSRSVCS